jgi:enoyl-CoA hydratase/carnithine racemase
LKSSKLIADNPIIGLQETLLGIVPDVGGCACLTRLIGVSRAKEMILTGKAVDADLTY